MTHGTASARVSFGPIYQSGDAPTWFSFDDDGVFVVSVNDGEPFAVGPGFVHTGPIRSFSIYGMASVKNG